MPPVIPSSQANAEVDARPEATQGGRLLPWSNSPAWLKACLFCLVFMLASLCTEWLKPSRWGMSFADYPAGLLFAGAYLVRRGRWLFLVLVAVVLRLGSLLLFDPWLAQSLAVCLFESVLALAGVLIARSLLHWNKECSEVRRFFIVVVSGVVLAPLAGAVIVHLVGPWLYGVGQIPSVASFFLSGALGVLGVLPLVLAYVETCQAEWRSHVAARRFEALAFIFGIPFLAWFAVMELPDQGLAFSLLFILPLVFCAFRFGLPGIAVTGFLLLGMLSCLGYSNFSAFSIDRDLSFLQAFCGTCLMVGHVVAARVDSMWGAARRLMGLFASTTELVVSFELIRDEQGVPVDYRLLDINPAFTLITGYTAAQAIGETASSLYGTERPPHLADLERMIQEGHPIAFDSYLPKARRHLKVTAFPTDRRNRFTVVATDVTQILEREAELLKSNRMYAVLSQINHSVVRSADQSTLLASVCQAFVEQGRLSFCWASWRSPGERQLQPIASAGGYEGFLKELGHLSAGHRDGLLAEVAVAEGRIVICNDFQMDPMARAWGEAAARNGFRSAAAFPIRMAGGVVGSICLYSSEAVAFSTKELSLLNAAAADISHALDGLQRETARLRTLAELQDSELRFRALFEQSPIAYLRLDAQGAVLDVNPAWLHLAGCSRPECLGRFFIDYLAPSAKKSFLDGFRRIAVSGGECSLELSFAGLQVDGVTAVVAVRAEMDSAGQFRAGHCMVFDITERKRFEDAIRVSEQRLTLAFEIASDGIWELNLQTGDVYLSHRFYTMLGYESGERIKSLADWKQLVQPEDLLLFETALESFERSSAEELRVEYRIRHKQGPWLWVLTRGRVVETDAQGQKLRVIGTNSNITERKVAEETLKETALKYRGYIDESPVPVLILDQSGVVIEANPSGCQVFGLSASEMVGLGFPDLVDATSAEVAKTMLRTLSVDGRGEGELRGRRKNGAALFLSAQAVGIASGRFLMFCQDITARRRTEQALHARESMLESILHTALDGFWIIDGKGRLVEVNESYCRASGYNHKELLQMRVGDLEAMETTTLIEQHIERIRRTGSDRWESSHRRKDGSLLDVEVSATYMPVEDGRIVAFIQDITDRKKAETALRQSQRRLALIIEGSALAAWDWNLRTGEVVYNAHWARLAELGTEDGSMDQRAWCELQHPDDRARVEEAMRLHLEGRIAYFDCEYRIRRRDGRYVWVMDRGQVIAREASGQPLRATGTQRDITARKTAEERVRQQAALLDQTQDIILATDIAGVIRFCNRSAQYFFGRKAADIEGTSIELLLAETDPLVSSALLRNVADTGEWHGELRFLAPTRMDCVWDTRWSLVRAEEGDSQMILITGTDVSEKKMLESRFLRSQRMESIGALATGVAHDLNNIFLPITLAANMLRQNPPADQQASLHAMLDLSAQRGADIVRQLLTFSRGLDGRRIELQPRMIIHEIKRIVSETFPKNITLDCQTADDLWTILADPTQIHQVLLNLCVNARDAMPLGGVLTVLAENVVFDEYYAAMNPDAEAGPYVVLQVGDTGVGIAPEHQEKIFDPFFTTKAQGQGTGLGLSTVHGIVKSHRGFIQVRSQPGQGAQFKVYLPAIPTYVEVKDEEPSAEPMMGEGETLLVVDDEEAVRKSLRHLLEAHGYRVITAVDGREGMVCYVEQKDQIRVIVTDIMMPVMDGTELIRAVRRITPTVPVIGMSGLPEKENASTLPGAHTDYFLVKPFVSDQLLTTLRAVLTGGLSTGEQGGAGRLHSS